MPEGFLEQIGAVKTARREAESLLLAKTTLEKEPVAVKDLQRMVRLAKHNKVLLRAATALGVPKEDVENAVRDVREAFQLYDLMSETLDGRGIQWVVIKSFDSLPDMGHDLDFLVSEASDFTTVRSMLLNEFRVRPQSLTHCDKLLGKFSCFLPSFTHDFEIYPAISQLGEEHVNPAEVMTSRRKERVQGREITVTSPTDGALIRVVHAMYRHNFLKLSDILDFLTLIQACDRATLIEKADRSGIGDAFLFFLATVDRFLKACNHRSAELDLLVGQAHEKLGPDKLRFFRRDRLVLPYRIPAAAIIILFLLKAGREAARGRFKSAGLCLTTPPLILLDFLNAVFSHRLFLRRIW